MQSSLSHIEVNVAQGNLPFYRELMLFLGWDPLAVDDSMAGYGCSSGTSLWFVASGNSRANDYDGYGVNHLAIGAPTVADVDAVVAYLGERGVAPLFETPRHRPDFAEEGANYYQVMFESPDRVLFEVVCTGPRET